jgi:hypothetical protein
VTDIFREVEEDVRREQLEKIWKDYGDYIIAAVALVIIAVAGVQLWRIYEQKQTARATASFALAQELLAARQPAAAETLFAKLADTAPGGYAKLALLQKANALSAAGDAPAAIDIYKKIATGNDAVFAPIARIRAGWALVDTAPRSDLETLLKPLLDPGNTWHALAQEILAYSDYRNGTVAKAQSEFRRISNDPGAPSDSRQRSEAMATFLAAGGDANFGTVPEPVLPTAPANAQGAQKP